MRPVQSSSFGVQPGGRGVAPPPARAVMRARMSPTPSCAGGAAGGMGRLAHDGSGIGVTPLRRGADGVNPPTGLNSGVVVGRGFARAMLFLLPARRLPLALVLVSPVARRRHLAAALALGVEPCAAALSLPLLHAALARLHLLLRLARIRAGCRCLRRACLG